MQIKFIDKVLSENEQKAIDTDMGQVYIACPEKYEKGGTHPLLIALHGSGREALSYRDVPFYAMQRDIALECGYVFAAVSNDSDTYGLDAGLKNVHLLYDYMQKEYNLYEKTALWASSAGGFMMHRLYRERQDIFGLLLGTFPVFDPLTIKPLNSMLRAFDVKTADEFYRNARFLSPKLYEKDIYKKAHIVIAHGMQDEAVPISQSEGLEEQVTKYGGRMDLIKKPGGHSTQNFALYDTECFHDALKEYRKDIIASFLE
jgi:hypothetical protein